MKSSQRKATNITTSWTKGAKTNQNQPKPTTQSYKPSAPSNYGNRRTNPPANIPKTTPNITKNTYQLKKIYQPVKINDTYNSGNKRTNVQINIPKKDEKQKWQNSRDGRQIGDTETKVETKQEGDYLIKVTTTRKVIDKKSYEYGGIRK